MKVLVGAALGVLYVAGVFGAHLVFDTIDDDENPIANKWHAAAIWIVTLPLFGCLLARDAVRERMRQ